MLISQILDRKGRNVVTAGTDDIVLDIVIKLHTYNIGAVPVIDAEGTVVGIVSERDVVDAIATQGHKVVLGPVANIMTRPVLLARGSDHIQSATRTMIERRVRHLPVTEDGRLAGIVSIGDLLKPHLDESRLETAVLRDMAKASLVGVQHA